MNKERYSQNNFHVIISNDRGLLYDVPSNTIFKISSDAAKKILQLQLESYDILSAWIDQKLLDHKITIPNHYYWWEQETISKLTINVTSRCNLRCKYCYANFGTFSGYDSCDMTPTAATNYIKAIIDLGVKCIDSVQFFGGEPLLAIDTIDSICECFYMLYDHKLIRSIPTFTMITNCVEGGEKIYSIIKKYNIRLTISVDGPQEINDLQRVFPNGRGTYAYISSNMEALKSQISAVEVTYTKNHIVNNVLFKDLKKYFNYRLGISMENIDIIPVVGNHELEIPQHILKQYWDEDSFTTEDSFVLSACYPEKQSDLFCTAGFNSFCIMPNGDLYPCHMYASNRDYCLGNILTGIKFVHIKELLNKLPLCNKNIRVECNLCWARKICHLCPAKALISANREGDIINRDICEFRKKRYEKKLLQAIYYESERENHVVFH